MNSLALAAFGILGGWGQYDSLGGYHIFAYALAETEIEDALQTAPQLDIHLKSVTKRLGDEWARTGRSLSLRVPGVRLPFSWNCLINPDHDDFAEKNIEHLGLLRWDAPIAELLHAARRK